MKYEKTQKGKNPHCLTIKQHVFPAHSIKRFADAGGMVSVRLLQKNRTVPRSPKHKIFCAMRVWDQRAETYMTQIETQFQYLAIRIVDGLTSLTPEEHAAVSRFFVLWHIRATRRTQPEPDYLAKAVTPFPKEIELELGEKLEKAGVSFIHSDSTIPGRVILGRFIEQDIDFLMMDTVFSTAHWGVLTAAKGEFVIPDYIGLDTRVVPISPTICLAADHTNTVLIASNVANINSSMAAAAREYLIAHNFTNCPML